MDLLCANLPFNAFVSIKTSHLVRLDGLSTHCVVVFWAYYGYRCQTKKHTNTSMLNILKRRFTKHRILPLWLNCAFTMVYIVVSDLTLVHESNLVEKAFEITSISNKRNFNFV